MKTSKSANRLLTAFVGAVALLASSSAHAGLVFYEPFSASVFPDNFSLGKTETNGWNMGNSPSSHGCSTVSSAAALSYEGLATVAGSRGVARSANTTGSHRSVGKPFGAAITTNSVYCAFLVKAVAPSTTNRCVLSLNRSTGSKGFETPTASVWIDAGGHLLVGKNSGTSAPEATAALGDKTAFVVLKYTFKAGTNDDEVALYLNPKPGQPEPSKPALATAGGEDIKELVAFALPQGRASDTTHGADSGEIHLDEIRVGTTWADVTPAAETKQPSGK